VIMILRHVPAQPIALAFFAQMKGIQKRVHRRMTQMTMHRAMAFVAFDEATMRWGRGFFFFPRGGESLRTIYETGE